MRRAQRIAHPAAARQSFLERLLRIVKANYRREWASLRKRATEAADVEALVDGIEAWLRRYSLLDADGLAVPAAVALLAEDLPHRPELVKAAMVFALRGHIKAQMPALAHFNFTFTYCHVFGDGAPWLRGFDPSRYREALIADAVDRFRAALEKELTPAMEEYVRRCNGAGIETHSESLRLQESLGLLARYLMRGATIAELAEESGLGKRRLDDATISRRLQEAARSCGLTLRRPGRRKKTAD
jgi:hypothetical protein